MKNQKILFFGILFFVLLIVSCASGRVKEPSWMSVSDNTRSRNPDIIYGRGFAETWTSETAIIAARSNAVAHAAQQARLRAVTDTQRFISDSNYDNPEITSRVIADINLRTDFDFAYRSTHREIYHLKDGRFRAFYGVSVNIEDVNPLIIESIEKEPELADHLNRASELYRNFRNQFSQ